MYRPHYCKFFKISQDFDEHRNPISIVQESSKQQSCFFDRTLPKETPFSADGQPIKDPAGVVYLSPSLVKSIGFALSEGMSVEVFEKESNSLLFKGNIKSVSFDLFHCRLWV